MCVWVISFNSNSWDPPHNDLYFRPISSLEPNKHITVQPEGNGLSRSWCWRLWFKCPLVPPALTVQQDWLKQNGPSLSFLPFFLFLFCSWTLSVWPLCSSFYGMESTDIYIQWLQFWSAFPLMNVAASIFFCCSPSALGRWLWPVLTSVWAKLTLLVPLFICLHFRPSYEFSLSH